MVYWELGFDSVSLRSYRRSSRVRRLRFQSVPPDTLPAPSPSRTSRTPVGRAEDRGPLDLLTLLIFRDPGQCHGRRRRNDGDRHRRRRGSGIGKIAAAIRRPGAPRRNGTGCAAAACTRRSRCTRACSRSASRSMSDERTSRAAGGRAAGAVRGRECWTASTQANPPAPWHPTRRRTISRSFEIRCHSNISVIPPNVCSFSLSSPCYDSSCRRSRSEILSNVRHSRCTPSPSSPPGTTRHAFPENRSPIIAGRPMIEHVYTRAAAAPGVDAVVVATDDARIAAGGERHSAASSA